MSRRTDALLDLPFSPGDRVVCTRGCFPSLVEGQVYRVTRCYTKNGHTYLSFGDDVLKSGWEAARFRKLNANDLPQNDAPLKDDRCRVGWYWVWAKDEPSNLGFVAWCTGGVDPSGEVVFVDQDGEAWDLLSSSSPFFAEPVDEDGVEWDWTPGNLDSDPPPPPSECASWAVYWQNNPNIAQVMWGHYCDIRNAYPDARIELLS